jgi:hypothetical protein
MQDLIRPRLRPSQHAGSLFPCCRVSMNATAAANVEKTSSNGLSKSLVKYFMAVAVCITCFQIGLILYIYIYIYIYPCKNTYSHIPVCVCIEHVRSCAHPYIHTHTHIYIYMHTFMYMHTCIHKHTCLCDYTCGTRDS